MYKIVILFSLFCIGNISYADDTEEEPRQIIYNQRTEIDFEGIEVQGQLLRPQGILLLDRKKGSFNPLIQLREDFEPELNESVNYIK